MTDEQMDRSYSSLLTPRGKIIFKKQKEFLRKIPKNCERPYIFDKYVDLENLDGFGSDNPCKSTAVILTGIHNETINIYSHLLPMIFIIIEMLYFKYNESTTTISTSCYGVSMMICFLFSVYYHCGCCISPSKYNHLLQVDLFGVYLCFFVSVLSGIYIGFNCNQTLQIIYASINCIIFIFVLFPVLFIYGKSIRFYLKKILFTILLLCELIPLFHWIYLYYPLLTWFWYAPAGMFGGYFIGGIFWHYRIPEVFAPGKFDLIGHSHQIWHIFIVIASFCWWYGLHDLTKYWNDNACNNVYVY